MSAGSGGAGGGAETTSTATYVHNYQTLQQNEPVYYQQQNINTNIANITEVIAINSGSVNTILTPISKR